MPEKKPWVEGERRIKSKAKHETQRRKQEGTYHRRWRGSQDNKERHPGAENTPNLVSQYASTDTYTNYVS